MGLREWFRGKVPALGVEYKPGRSNIVETHDVTQFHGYLSGDGKRWNPDDLVGKKGLTIYSQMLNDEQVKSVTEFKLNAILGRGYQFKFPASTDLSDDEQKERIQVFEEVLRKMRGSFVDALEGIASGREFGFSLTEKVYGDITVRGKQFVGVNMLLTRDPCSFDFYADEYGILQRITQHTPKASELPIERRKVIHYVHKPKWDLIYGRSELRSAYRSWYAKEQLIRSWLTHLEKFGSGITVATQNAGAGAEDGTPAGIASGTPAFTALQNALKQMKAFGAAIFPPGIQVETQWPTTTDQYEKALQYFDLAIAKSQLVPNLLGLSHTGQTGAYAQSQTQLEAFFWTTGADGARLCECLNEDLFRDLGDQNWGDGDYPQFCFKPVSMEHIKWVVETWVKLTQSGAVLTTEEDERLLRQMLEMGERDPDDKPVTDPMADRQQEHTEKQAEVANDHAQQALDQKQQELDQRKADARLARIETRLEYLSQPLNVTVNNPAPAQQSTPPSDPLTHSDSAVGAVIVPHNELRTCTRAQFTRAVQRVAFSVIEKRTDDYAAAAVTNLAGIMAKATKRALGDDANMSQLLDEDPADVAALDIAGADRSKIKSACRDLLTQSWTLGSDLAANELDRAQGEQTPFVTRRAKFASLRDKAAGFFEAQSFRMAGDASDLTRKIIQQELQNGVKFGKTVQDVRAAIWDRLIAKGLTTTESVKGIETDQDVLSKLDEFLADTEASAAYLNTLVRTNSFEALNEARFAEFTDPEVAEFVQALEYAAVLDGSTTEICRALDGKTYAADSDQWDTIRPPNHYNCRSVLVPVTTIDEWDGQESVPPSVEPAEGFK